jgi:hypothetical protein
MEDTLYFNTARGIVTPHLNVYISYQNVEFTGYIQPTRSESLVVTGV